MKQQDILFSKIFLTASKQYHSQQIHTHRNFIFLFIDSSFREMDKN